jgi:hypothetical protein
VFDRYFQTSQPDKPAEGGTGIGLAIGQEYAMLFGGKIEVESAMGMGSIFRIAFPVKLEESLQTAAESSDPEDLLIEPFANTEVKNHTTGHICFTQRRHARNALITKGNRYQPLQTLRRCVENVQ